MSRSDFLSRRNIFDILQEYTIWFQFLYDLESGIEIIPCPVMIQPYRMVYMVWILFATYKAKESLAL